MSTTLTEGSVMTKKVLIVDDHPIVRQGLVQLINAESDFEVSGEASDGMEALDHIKKHSPDIAVVDISLRGRSGLDLIKDIKAQYEKLPVLVLSMHKEDLYAARALRAGARGYLMKDEVTEKFLSALRTILRGEVAVSQKMASHLLERAASGRVNQGGSPVDDLTDRELEVFGLLGTGLSTRQISEKLNLSIKTVETHRAHIMDKLGVEHAPALIQQAVEWFHTKAD